MVCDISIEYPVIAAFVKHAHPKCFTTLWMVDTKAMHLLPPPCASFMSFFLFFTSFLYLAVSEYISRCGCYVLLLVFLACFQMGFYFATTGWIFEIGLLCENSTSISKLQSASGLCWIVRARELVLLYKWVGWIRQGGGEVDVCQ